jgi:hypothetical protein
MPARTGRSQRSEVDQVVEHAFETWDVWRLYGDPPYWESALDRWAGATARAGVALVDEPDEGDGVRAARLPDRHAPGVMSHDGDELLAEHIGNAIRHETRMREDDGAAVGDPQGGATPPQDRPAMAACLSWKARGDAIAPAS